MSLIAAVLHAVNKPYPVETVDLEVPGVARC